MSNVIHPNCLVNSRLKQSEFHVNINNIFLIIWDADGINKWSASFFQSRQALGILFFHHEGRILFFKCLYLLIGQLQRRLIITEQVTPLGLPMAQSQFEFGDIFSNIASIYLKFLLCLLGLIKFEMNIKLSDLNHLFFGDILQRWKVRYQWINSILYKLLCWSCCCLQYTATHRPASMRFVGAVVRLEAAMRLKTSR